MSTIKKGSVVKVESCPLHYRSYWTRIMENNVHGLVKETDRGPLELCIVEFDATGPKAIHDNWLSEQYKMEVVDNV